MNIDGLRGRGRFLVGALVCTALLVSTGTVWAGTITGTKGNDTLTGTAKNDKLVGKGGNDKLYGKGGNDTLVGGPGNDLLVGGPGHDVLSCGSGKDVARADKFDKVSTDCEVVTGIPAETPTPPTPPTPPPPPAPTPITAGNYQGLLDGNFIYFTVFSDRTIAGFRSNYIREDCDQGGYVYGTLDWGTTHFPIGNDASFGWAADGTGTVGDSPATFHDEVHGQLNGTNASGTVLGSSEFDYQGTHFKCTSGQRPWTASLVP